MSVPSTTGRNEFNFNGSLTSFTFDFPIIETSDLLVIVCLIATGVETPLTEGTDYEVTSALGDFSSGGIVSMIEYIDDVKTPKAWPATYKLILLRNVPVAQGIDFTENMATLYQNFEDGLDKLTMLIQQIQEIQDRTLTVPQSEASTLSRELPTAVARKNMLLGFDENGEPCAAYPGEQGPTGATGPTGAAGADGADGSDGADAAEITAVAWDGNDMKFTKDDATTFSLTGAKTDLKGEKGDTGLTGPQGPAGPLDDDFSVYTEKTSTANDDTFLINDSGDSGAVKRVKKSNITGGASIIEIQVFS